MKVWWYGAGIEKSLVVCGTPCHEFYTLQNKKKKLEEKKWMKKKNDRKRNRKLCETLTCDRQKKPF